LTTFESGTKRVTGTGTSTFVPPASCLAVTVSFTPANASFFPVGSGWYFVFFHNY
jgi:hypothetical protein